MSSARRVSRAQCNNCTCSPGLLSRTNKRSSAIAKRINLRRSLSGSSSPNGSRKGSVFTLNAASLCLPEVKEVNTSKRLEALKAAMAANDVAVYIIPSEDEHQSEYVAPIDQRRNFISGFSGSAGTCIVTRDITSMNEVPEGLAALATDGRYYTQATEELDFNWQLVKTSPQKWAVEQAVQLSLDSGAEIKIGVDPKLVSYSMYEKFVNAISEQLKKTPEAKVDFVPVKDNLVDSIWMQFEELPVSDINLVKTLDVKYAGEDVRSKIQKVVAALKEHKSHSVIVSALDEIAWLLNLRGADIQFNPVFYSYLILSENGTATLYADNTKFDSNVNAHLSSYNVSVKPYRSFWSDVVATSMQWGVDNQSVLLDSKSASWELVRVLKCKYETASPSPIQSLKAIKNEVELQGAKTAHLKDGRALVKFFSWLEQEVAVQSELVDEIKADDYLTELRSQESNFVGLSFDTISATGANGAIIHYKPLKGTCKTIDPNKIYLNDSGAQFLEGTTDTTRTVHFGNPTAQEKKHYTLVLKGNLALGNLKFPQKTTGGQIDSIARQFLWQYGLDYGHGTAHGIGAYLNVHEGPIGIGPVSNSNPLLPGHLISNEPGFYEEGEYGIRIENNMFVKESGSEYNGKKFYEFETITRVPYCRKLIDESLLTAQEKSSINEYHGIVWKELSEMLEKNSSEWKWLKRETTPL